MKRSSSRGRPLLMPALKKSKIGSREAGPRGKSVHLVNEGRPARSRLARKRPPTRDVKTIISALLINQRGRRGPAVRILANNSRWVVDKVLPTSWAIRVLRGKPRSYHSLAATNEQPHLEALVRGLRASICIFAPKTWQSFPLAVERSI